MLSQILSLNEARVLVIGDVMIDKYVSGKTQRLSPEAPVPVIRPDARWSVPGGAANVAMNIASLGATVGLICALSNDPASAELSAALTNSGVAIFPIESNRQTPVKTRIRTDLQHIVRIDDEIVTPLDVDDQVLLIAEEQLVSGSFNVLLISDYAKGLLNEVLLKSLILLGNGLSIPVITDPKSTNPSDYENVTMLKPNLHEARALLSDEVQVENGSELIQVAQSVRAVTKAESVVVTAAGLGSALASESHSTYFKAIPDLVVRDVSGAGDTFISYLSAGISSGAEIGEVCQIATLAASLSCRSVGTTPVSTSELAAFLITEFDESGRKVVSREVLKELIEFLPRPIVFTNGCFDVLHPGHIKSLEFAKSQGRTLIVGCNSDLSVTRIKGPNRPLQDFDSRSAVLAALSCTSIICELTEDTPFELIEIVQPDVLVKGADYLDKEVVGRSIVESRGGHVELSPTVSGFSTSEFENRIRRLLS
jgi:D-beta-D-heptose 7-phosphate kinase/D-beta-D-heptose 1-phosphate adenosyltransferase